MKKRPNVVFVLSDDQGAWAMGCAGNKDLKTPNLDRLAEEGVRFENFYCASPVCSPARATLVTGEMPSCHGIQDWLCGGNVDAWKYPELNKISEFNREDHAIDYLEGHKTYMEVLAENGYDCYLSGKWHLGDNVKKKKGFKKWFSIARGGCHYFMADTCEEGEVSLSDRYVTDLITEKALEYLDQEVSKEQPFYMSVHYTAPHSPWEAHEHQKPYLDLYRECEFQATPDLPVHPWQINTCPVGDTPQKRKENLTGYYAAISAMDAGIGKIVDKIREKGLEEDTIVIFTADNGMNMGHHGIWGKGNGTYPPNMFESAVKVPFIIKIPGTPYKGEVCSAMTSQYDVFPTMLELTGCKEEIQGKQPGRSMVSLLNHREEDRENRIVIYDEYGKTRMIKKGAYKYVHHYGGPTCEFYDLEKDPEETENLYESPAHQEIISRMKKEMEDWFERYTEEALDARKHDVTGLGQKTWCNKENAFAQQYEYYNHSKNDDKDAISG